MTKPYMVKRDGTYWRIWDVYGQCWGNIYSEDRRMIERSCAWLNGEEL